MILLQFFMDKTEDVRVSTTSTPLYDVLLKVTSTLEQWTNTT